jgi:hypothetical protein
MDYKTYAKCVRRVWGSVRSYSCVCGGELDNVTKKEWHRNHSKNPFVFTEKLKL